jgi:hypothetical protein
MGDEALALAEFKPIVNLLHLRTGAAEAVDAAN